MLLPHSTSVARRAPPIAVAVVADRETTRGALLSIVEDDPELYGCRLGSFTEPS